MLTQNTQTYNYRGYRNVTLSALKVCKSINAWLRLVDSGTVVPTGKMLDILEPETSKVIGQFFEPNKKHHRRAAAYRERYQRRVTELLGG